MMTGQSQFAEFAGCIRRAWKTRRLIERERLPTRASHRANRSSAPTRRCLGTIALGCLALAIGCQNPNLAPATNGIGGALSPPAVRQYAQQHGISDAQARQELQQKVSRLDEEQAVKNIDENGAVQR